MKPLLHKSTRGLVIETREIKSASPHKAEQQRSSRAVSQETFGLETSVQESGCNLNSSFSNLHGRRNPTDLNRMVRIRNTPHKRGTDTYNMTRPLEIPRVPLLRIAGDTRTKKTVQGKGPGSIIAMKSSISEDCSDEKKRRRNLLLCLARDHNLPHARVLFPRVLLKSADIPRKPAARIPVVNNTDSRTQQGFDTIDSRLEPVNDVPDAALEYQRDLLREFCKSRSRDWIMKDYNIRRHGSSSAARSSGEFSGIFSDEVNSYGKDLDQIRSFCVDLDSGVVLYIYSQGDQQTVWGGILSASCTKFYQSVGPF